MFIDSKNLQERLEKGKVGVGQIPKTIEQNSGLNSPTRREPIPLIESEAVLEQEKETNRSGDLRGMSDGSRINLSGEIEGRGSRGAELPKELRIAAGILAKTSGIKNTSKALDIGITATQAAKFGAVTGHKESDPEIKDRIEEAFKPVRDKAIERILKGLNFLDDGKLQEAKGGELSKILMNLSAVAKNTVIENQANLVNAPIFVYKANQKETEAYETIEVN